MDDAARAAGAGGKVEGSLRPVRSALLFGFFNATTWQVALATPMVMFAERLGASTAAVGWAYSFVFLMTPVQVLSTALLPRFGFKRMMLSGWGARSLFLLPPLGLAWLAPESGERWHVAVFVGSLFCFTFFRSIGSCAWLPWINSLLTPGNRGRYFASEQAVSGIGGVGTLLLCALSFKLLPVYWAFFLQYGVAFVGSWFAYGALARLPDAPRPAALSLRDVMRQTPELVTQRGHFREFVFIGVLTGLAVTALPPFCAYYLKVEAGASYGLVLIYTTVQFVGVIAGAALIRNRVDHLGARPFFQLSLFVYAAIALFWLVLLRGWGGGLVLMPVVYFLIGVAASCWAAANMKYLPLVVSEERQMLAFSVHSAVTSVISGISPVVWGVFIKGESEQPSVDVGAFQAFFVVALLTTVVVAALVARLPAAAGTRVDWPLGGMALRPFRGFINLASLVQPAAPPVAAVPKSEPSPAKRPPPP